MTLYRAEIRPLGAYASPLQSDTFFGAFCWAYRYLNGEEQLEKMLRENLVGNQQTIFSNAFPSGYLPLPVGACDLDRTRLVSVEKGDARKAYQQNKKYKKCTLVSREAFRKMQNGEWRGYSQSLAAEEGRLTKSVHNMVNRSDGTVGHSDAGGNLFAADEFYMEPGKTFDVYVLSDLDRETLDAVLSLMFELGIGAKKSTGKGAFQILSMEEETELISVSGANGYVALSNFIPVRDDPTEGYYKTFVKYGKVDREYAVGYYPFKKPLLYIQAGAMFKADGIREYYGSYIMDASEIQGVVVNACTIALPIQMQEKE